MGGYTRFMDSVKNFSFDSRQRGILYSNGIAAFVQRPRPKCIGWVYASYVTFPEWQPQKVAYRCLHIEVTWDSFERIYSERPLWQPEWRGSGLMVTKYEWFLTEEIEAVGHFFSRFIDRPEFARWPDEVCLPMDLPGDRAEDLVDPFYSIPEQLERQGEARYWLENVGIIHDLPEIRGTLLSVGLDYLTFMTESGEKSIPFPKMEAWCRYILDSRVFNGYLDFAVGTVWDYKIQAWVRVSEL